MINKTAILNLIKNYTIAFLIAEENPGKMLSGEITSDEAVTRMDILAKAENELFGYSICLHTEAPSCLKAHFEAIDDYACGRCWMSSNKTNLHTECEKKIDKFFKTRKDLIEFGKALMGNK